MGQQRHETIPWRVIAVQVAPREHRSSRGCGMCGARSLRVGAGHSGQPGRLRRPVPGGQPGHDLLGLVAADFGDVLVGAAVRLLGQLGGVLPAQLQLLANTARRRGRYCVRCRSGTFARYY